MYLRWRGRVARLTGYGVEPARFDAPMFRTLWRVPATLASPARPARTRGSPNVSTSLWHGFADMHVVKDAELVLREGDGVWVTDVDGRRYLDSTASLWYCNVGFGRGSIADAVADQLRRLAAYSSFGAYTTETTVRLADRIAAMAP